MEARGGLRLQDNVLGIARVLNAKLLNCNGRQLLQSCGPLFRTEVQVFGSNEIADEAALVRFGQLRPPGVVRFVEKVGFVEHDGRTREQIEERLLGASDRGVEFPSGKDAYSGVAHSRLDRIVIAREAVPAETRINGSERVFVHGSLG